MAAYTITLSIDVECEDYDIAMATVQEMVSASIEQRSDDPFGLTVDIYSAHDWLITEVVA